MVFPWILCLDSFTEQTGKIKGRDDGRMATAPDLKGEPDAGFSVLGLV